MSSSREDIRILGRTKDFLSFRSMNLDLHNLRQPPEMSRSRPYLQDRGSLIVLHRSRNWALTLFFQDLSHRNDGRSAAAQTKS
jgi:hypothetical protein